MEDYGREQHYYADSKKRRERHYYVDSKRRRERLRRRRRLEIFSKAVATICVFIVSWMIIEMGMTVYDAVTDKSIPTFSTSMAGNSTTLDGVEIEGETTVERIRFMAGLDERAQAIFEHYDEYPQDLLDMLARNVDMLDFVEGYPEKNGNVYADSVGEVEKGKIPLLLQWDERWGYGEYGDGILAVCGCGPTALSMVVSGLTGDASVTPYVVAEYADDNGYYVQGTGSKWSLISEGCQNFGVAAEELPLSQNVVYGALEAGRPIICSVRPGDFTTTGHFIVLVGVEDGKIRVNDSNSRERSQKLWDYQTLERQIDNLWAFSVR